jgi:diacylglycerol kinase (ATP)
MGKYHKSGFWRSLIQAWRGLRYAYKTQKHLQFHGLATVVVAGVAWWSKVTLTQWALLFFAIGSVFCAEVMNTALEIVVDMVQPNFHPLAGMAKDVAAGAVLVASIQAIVIGLVVFFPKLLRLTHIFL